MDKITPELIIIPLIGLLLLIVAVVQYMIGKVYTRGSRGFKWHKKSVVSRYEAPVQFWVIISLQFGIGLFLVFLSIMEYLSRSNNW